MTLESSGRTAEAPLARVVAVRKTYGEVIALDDVSLELPRGGLIGLLGPNGAGKSTLIGLLCGQRKPTAGQVEIFGGDPRMAANRVRLGMTPQETGLPPTLKVREVGHSSPPTIPTRSPLALCWSDSGCRTRQPARPERCPAARSAGSRWLWRWSDVRT
ncbi:MAG: ATP-binding cassette domain-containing protein [Geodermatophilaceae bacterium]